MGRKNRLFIDGHEGGDRSAVILTVIANAHRHDLDAWAYLRAFQNGSPWAEPIRRSSRRMFATSLPATCTHVP